MHDSEEIQAQVQRNADAIRRIGQESRTHEVHISDLDKRVTVGEQWRASLDKSLDRLTAASERLAETMDKNRIEFQAHLLKDAHDESRYTRQSIYLWLSLVGGGAGWLMAVFGGAVTHLISGGNW
jgi:hypothetical protein